VLQHAGDAQQKYQQKHEEEEFSLSEIMAEELIQKSSEQWDHGNRVTELDFGVVGVGEAREVSFNLTNANPVPVDLKLAKSSLNTISLVLSSLTGPTGELLPLPPSPLTPQPPNATAAELAAWKKQWTSNGWVLTLNAPPSCYCAVRHETLATLLTHVHLPASSRVSPPAMAWPR
jgi:hypothetical protein